MCTTPLQKGVCGCRQVGGLEGIVNGCDVNEWSPFLDKYLDVKYDAESMEEGKAIAKETLQAELGLQVGPSQEALNPCMVSSVVCMKTRTVCSGAGSLLSHDWTLLRVCLCVCAENKASTSSKQHRNLRAV